MPTFGGYPLLAILLFRSLAQASDAANGNTLPTTTARCQSPEKLNTGAKGLYRNASPANAAATPWRFDRRAWNVTTSAPEVTRTLTPTSNPARCDQMTAAAT